MRLVKWIVAVLLSSGTYVFAQQAQFPIESTPSSQENEFIDDNLIVAALDSLSNLKYFESVENTKSHLFNNKYNFLPNFIPSYPDSVYYYRLQRLDVESPIELTYNNYVRAFIELYANRKRGTTSRVLGLAQIYFPLIEQQLDMYNLPLELKYLAIVESALNPEARSRVGASGLWQFMYYTGKVYGLEATSYVDDRNDPVKATTAACKHFRDLYNIYHDWLLVLAAYNSGPGNVNKAIRRSGGKMSFWEIRSYLPRETRDYVPAFIAVNYVMNYSNEHNLYPVMPRIVYHETDTVAVISPLTISLLADKLKIPVEDLEFLNPTFRKGFIPATANNPYFIRLPKKSVADFINNEQSLYAAFQLKGYDPAQFMAQTADEAAFNIVTKKITHKVHKGENIGSIARKYDCSTQEIKKWNHLRRASVYNGQKLAIYVQTRVAVPGAKNRNKTSPQEETQEKNLAQNNNDSLKEKVEGQQKPAPVAVKAKYHVVKKGEYLTKIATKYNVSVTDLLAWNKLKNRNVVVGQKIRINAPALPAVAVAAKADTNEKVVSNIKEGNSGKEKLIFYTVQTGDTLWSIAEKYEGITVNQIREWNNLSSSEKLKVGQKIKVIVPGG
ncbi:MAG: LysM peptidoglycan-binding domain-containing protein [Bacteroidetes bacterium]|nr:LysM peptidoglycan-binding domain-containing protein [Bacteroidota bacterium]